jgi:hypothetical protein
MFGFWATDLITEFCREHENVRGFAKFVLTAEVPGLGEYAQNKASCD